RGVAVAVAGWTRGAGLAETPGGAEPFADAAGEHEGVLGRGGARLGDRRLRQLEEQLLRVAGIDDAAAAEVGRRAGHGQQRGRDEPAGGGLGDGDGFAAGAEPAADPFAECAKILIHGIALTLTLSQRERGR